MRAHVWTRITSFTAIAVLVAGVTTTANAQAKPTSQQRIPVQKESAGEVARRDSAARADSIAAAAAAAAAAAEAARRDSIARAEAARQDSINRAEAARRDSIARADSIAKAAAAAAAIEAARRDSIAREDSIRNAAAAFGRKGFFGGLAVGYSATSGKYGDVYDPGWNITVPIGWQRRAGRWGFRGDLMYDSHGGKSVTQDVNPDAIPTPYSTPPNVSTEYRADNASVWSGNLDVVVDLAKWGLNRLSQFYLIGGGGIHYFEKRQVLQTPLEPVEGATAPAPAQSYDVPSQTKFGLNGGAGFGFAIGRTSLFIESRYFTAYTNNTNSDWIPVILGVKWR